MAAEILIILVLLAMNGILAMSEIAIVTARKVRLEDRADAGDRGARAALSLAQDPTRFLSTIQVGITLIGVLAGAFGGARIATRLTGPLELVPWLAAYAEPVALAIVVTAITYLSLLIGELIPKRVALSRPERVAAIVARPVNLLSRIAAPIVHLLTGPTDLVLRLFGIRVSSEPSITADEIRALIEQGAESGALAQEEHVMMEQVLRLGDRLAGDVMIPRTEVEWIGVNDSHDVLQRRITTRPLGQYLVCDQSIENVAGVVTAEDLLGQLLSGGPLDLKAALRQPIFVPAATPALEVLSRLLETQQPLAVVLDEYGGLDGIVQVQELVAAVAGSLQPLGGLPIVRQDTHRWLVAGNVSIDDLESSLDLRIRDEVRRGARTVGGYIMTALERVPVNGDTVELDNHRLEIVTMDGRRVERVVVTRHPANVKLRPGGKTLP